MVPNWENWQPTQRATLCFIRDHDRVLLIKKKRGLGAGKFNAPGGRIEPGESPTACAIRETLEELHIRPLDPSLKGELLFHFTDGLRLHCAVFLATTWQGHPTETDEATPVWTPLHAIPFDQMWEDDRHWLPGLLQGRSFRARFHFHGETMLEKLIEWEPPSFWLL